MKTILNILIIALVSLLVRCQDQQKATDVASNGFLTSYLDLKTKLSQSPKFLALVMIAGEQCENCQKSIKIFEEYKQSMEGYTNSYFMNCDKMWDNVYERNHFQACNPQNSKAWPIVLFFKPPHDDYDPFEETSTTKANRSPEQIQYKDNLSLSRLKIFAQLHMPVFTQTANTKQEVQKQLDNTTIAHKVMLFIKSDEEIPIHFKALTSHFKYKIHFCVVIVDDDEELQNEYQIEETPSIIAFKYIRSSQKYKKEVYIGPKRIAAAKSFFQKYSSGIEKKESNTMYTPKQKTRNDTTTDVVVVQAFSDIAQRFDPDKGILLYLVTDQSSSDKFSIEQLSNITKYKTFMSLFKIYVDEAIVFEYQKYQKTVEQQDFFSLNKLSEEEDNLLFYPAGIKSMNTFFRVGSSMNKRQIIDDLLLLMEHKEDILDEEGIQYFISDSFSRNRIATTFFFDSNHKQTHELIFNVVYFSNLKKFRDCISFGIYKDITESTKQKWNISNLPFIITFLKPEVSNQGQLQTAIYDSSSSDFSYLPIYNYLSQLCYEKQKERIQSQSVIETNTQEIFGKNCGNEQECFIAILDYSRENKLRLDIGHFQTLSQHFSHLSEVNWVYIDGRCHKQILKKIGQNEQDLPLLVYYNSKKWKYKVMGESFVFNQMMEFTERILSRSQKRLGLKKLSDAFDIDERDCQKIREYKYDL